MSSQAAPRRTSHRRLLDAIGELYDDAPRCANMAGLRYVQADDPGLSRRRRGRGFSYRDAHGRPVDAGTVRRVVELAIPPAWRDVWICPDELGHILATGQDDRGRKQYLYHPKWRELRDLLNFYRLIVFANHLPEVRAHVQRQLRRRSLDRSRVLAAMVRIIDASAIRIGSEEYAEDNDSFGLTTLMRQHARVEGRRIVLRFPAKSGSRAELTLSDPGIARLIAELKQQRARRLFTVGGQPIDAVEVNALLSELRVNTLRRRISAPGRGRWPRSATCVSRSATATTRPAWPSKPSTKRLALLAIPAPSPALTTSIHSCWRRSATTRSRTISPRAGRGRQNISRRTNERC